MNNCDLLEISTELGYYLLLNGAEIYRVEESIVRILDAYGMKNGEVFAIPSCLITTVCDADGHSHTRMRRLPTRFINLDKVSQLNDLCRRLCNEKPEFDTARELICKIVKSPVYKPLVILAACMGASFAFTLFFKGNFFDALAGMICGGVMKIAQMGMEKFGTNSFFQNVISSMILTCIAAVSVSIGMATNMDSIIIGTLMNLVPGVATTNSIRDIIAGDLVAGLTRMTEAVMVAIAIALGTGVALFFVK